MRTPRDMYGNILRVGDLVTYRDDQYSNEYESYEYEICAFHANRAGDYVMDLIWKGRVFKSNTKVSFYAHHYTKVEKHPKPLTRKHRQLMLA